MNDPTLDKKHAGYAAHYERIRARVLSGDPLLVERGLRDIGAMCDRLASLDRLQAAEGELPQEPGEVMRIRNRYDFGTIIEHFFPYIDTLRARCVAEIARRVEAETESASLLQQLDENWIQHQRIVKCEARVKELEQALREMVESHTADYPPFEAGKDAQDAWSNRKANATAMSAVLLRDQASVVVTGPGGLGKTFNVLKALKANKLNDISTIEDREVGDLVSTKDSFLIVKGYSTPKGLYRTLYENRRGIIVFDDCDSVLKDPVSLNLLKGALDSYDRRIISWRADIRDEDLPTSFEFKGRVIFISNMSSVQLDQAIVSRSMVVDLTMTNAQKVERMYFLMNQEDFMPEFSMQVKKDAMGLIDELKDRVKELTLRTLIQVTKIRNSAGAKWKNLAEYTICG